MDSYSPVSLYRVSLTRVVLERDSDCKKGVDFVSSKRDEPYTTTVEWSSNVELEYSF